MSNAKGIVSLAGAALGLMYLVNRYAKSDEELTEFKDELLPDDKIIDIPVDETPVDIPVDDTIDDTTDTTDVFDMDKLLADNEAMIASIEKMKNTIANLLSQTESIKETIEELNYFSEYV